MRTVYISTILAAGFAVALAWGLCGCETESADAPLEISPKSVRLALDESQEFVVSGGYEYQWTLSHYSYGELNTYEGSRAVYTSRYSPGAGQTADQTITVTSYIPGAGAVVTGTNAVETVSVQAYVVHE